MSLFSRWWPGAVEGRGGRRCMYAAGEPVLVREVEDVARASSRFGSRGAIREVTVLESPDWPELRQTLDRPTFQDNKLLTVIRDGEKVTPKTWQEYASWARRVDAPHRDSRFLLVTSGERWNPKDTHDARHTIFVKASDGIYIECKPLNLDQQIRYADGKLRGAQRSLSQNPVPLLVDRCGGDLNRLRSECEKLISLSARRGISPGLVEQVVAPSPGEAFVDALLAGDRRGAIARAPYVGSVRFVIGSLEWTCAAMYLIRSAVQHKSSSHISVMKIAEKTRLDPFVVRKLRYQARTYDLSTVRRRYAALVVAFQDLMRLSDAHPEWILIPLATRW